MALLPKPRETKGALEPLANTYALRNALMWDYYPIKLGERKGQFVEIVKLPPVMQEGFVTYQKKLYKVELKDFIRSRVNVGQCPYAEPAAATSAGTTTKSDIGTLKLPESSNKSGTGISFEVQVDEAANLAWKEQIETLLHIIDPEEEWVTPTFA